MAGDTPVVVDPDKEPYMVVGSDLTMTLDWRAHVTRVIKTFREKVDALLASAASPKQMLQYEQSNIRPFVSYGFPVDTFTYDDICNLNFILAGLIKKAFSLPSSTPNGLVCREQQDGCMGCNLCW